MWVQEGCQKPYSLHRWNVESIRREGEKLLDFLCLHYQQYPQNSNVVEFYSLIKKGEGPNQRTWYNSGIGTYAKPSQSWLRNVSLWLRHKTDMVFAWCASSLFVPLYLVNAA